MSNDDEERAASAAPKRVPLPILTATVLTFALAAGCGAGPTFDDTSGGIPPTTELALSPNGQQLLVSWREKASKTQAKLLTLSGKTVTAVRDVSLPADTYTTAWSRSDHNVLVTTLHNDASELLRIDLRGDVRTVLHKSASRMRFPLEVGEDNYVFLEANEPGGRYSHWQRLQSGQKILLNDKSYSMAAPLDHVQGSLFTLEPRNPAIFRVFQGQLPMGLSALIDASTWTITCADKSPLTCVRTHVYFDPSGRTFGTMEIFNGSRRCDIGGRWLDVREIQVSRDGSTVVFHAPLTNVSGPRAIYVVNNDNVDCSPVQINIQGSK